MAKSKRKYEEVSRTPEAEPVESTVGAPDPDRVAQRAYELYLSRGGAEGQDMEDWFVAERELVRSRGSDDSES